MQSKNHHILFITVTINAFYRNGAEAGIFQEYQVNTKAAKALTSFVTSGPFYQHGLTLISAWISNYTHYNVWDEITYPFLNFNGATVEV